MNYSTLRKSLKLNVSYFLETLAVLALVPA
jgi:hypothetical protein